MFELSFFTSFYLHRFSGLHQQPLLFLCTVLCCGGECQICFNWFFYFFFLCLTCWVSSCRSSSPNGPSLARCRRTWPQCRMTCRWKKPIISTPLFIYALCKPDICGLEAAGFCWKPTGLGLPIVPADEDQRRKRGCQSWGEGSSADLTSVWKWPLAFWNDTNHSIALNLARFPSNGCVPFRSRKLAECFCHLQRCCRNHLPSELTLPVLSPCLCRYPIPLTQTVHPNSLSSPVRYWVRFLLLSLRFACGTCQAASENVSKVAVDSVDKSHACESLALYIRNVSALCSCRSHLCHT